MDDIFFIDNALKRFDKSTRNTIERVYMMVRKNVRLFVEEPDDYEEYQLDQAVLHAAICIITNRHVNLLERYVEPVICEIAKKIVYSVNTLNGFVA